MLAVEVSAFDGHRVRLTIGADFANPYSPSGPRLLYFAGCRWTRGKRLELLRTLVPKAASIACL